MSSANDMVDLFHIIDDAYVVLKNKGVYYQKKVFRRGNRLYAGWGSGFIRLGAGGFTSASGISHETLDLPEDLAIGKGAAGEPTLIVKSATQKAA